MATTRIVNLLDIYLSSFLILHGIEPKLEIKNGKVSFVFEGSERIYRLMNDFNGNTKVPVADFVTTVKTLRGKMLSFKEQGVTEKGERRNGKEA